MAAADSPSSHHDPSDTEPLDRLSCIRRAGWFVTTAARQQWRHNTAIQPDEHQQRPGDHTHRASHPSRAREAISTSSWKRRWRDPSSARTTTSYDPAPWAARNASLSRRRIRLRTTEFLARTASPRRSPPAVERQQLMVTPTDRVRVPARITFRKSSERARDRRRAMDSDLSREAGATLAPSGFEDRPTCSRLHTGPETMLALTAARVRLVSSLGHRARSFERLCPGSRRNGVVAKKTGASDGLVEYSRNGFLQVT